MEPDSIQYLLDDSHSSSPNMLPSEITFHTQRASAEWMALPNQAHALILKHGFGSEWLWRIVDSERQVESIRLEFLKDIAIVQG